MPKVYNKRHNNVPQGAVYVGRPTKWGNPFYMGTTQCNIPDRFQVKGRDEAVTRYEEWVKTQPDLLAALGELRGKDLVCWCAPAKCHADILLRLANQ